MSTTISVPAPPAPPAPPPFPIAATLAPVVMAIVLWAVTGMPYLLLFAALGPAIAVASLIDGRRQRRRAVRQQRSRYQEQLARTAERLDALREARVAERPDWPGPSEGLLAVDALAAWSAPAEPSLIVGRADVGSGLSLGELPDGLDDSERAFVEELAAEASWLRQAPHAIPWGRGVAVVGSPTIAAAFVRALILQLAAQLSPQHASFTAPPLETWARALPHRVDEGPPDRWTITTAGPEAPAAEGTIVWASRPELLAAGVDTVIRLPDAVPGAVRGDGRARAERLHPVLISRVEAQARARSLARAAHRAGVVRDDAALPDRVLLADLDVASAADGMLAGALGRDGTGAVVIDLLREGPHALVAGTTGSGKSEVLITWLVTLATRYSPREVNFLLVDYKGGATFARVSALPHVVGSVTDLDERRARRAILGLRAELRRRERVLADAQLRDVAELPSGALSRLVVMVDEYAALVAEHAEISALFADLAARGRSLGVHLVLCTQRPSGVVRDAIVANISLRLALRLHDRADSAMMLGSEAATRLDARPGRAVVVSAGGRRLFQVAQTTASDIAAVAARWAGEASVAQTWVDELPRRIPRSSLPPGPAFVLGLVDRPEDQRHGVARYDPRDSGALLIVGAPRSGRSTALALLAENRAGACAVPPRLADAWGVLSALDQAAPEAMPAILLIDDLDALLLAAEQHSGAAALEFAGLVERVVRRLGKAGVAVAAAVGKEQALRGMQHLFGGRVLLRHATRDDHVIAGLDARDFDPEAPPGRGWWGGRLIQLALPGVPQERLLASCTPSAPIETLPVHPDRGVVTARPAARAAAWRSQGVPVVELGRDAVDTVPAACILVGDPDAWQAAWAILAEFRRSRHLLIDATVSPAEIRMLTRARGEPPPLGESGEEWWLASAGELRRVRLRVDSPPAADAAREG